MRDKYLLLLPFAGAIALFTVLFQPTAKVIADGGDITTVAGTLGSGGASGDGGPATSARLAGPVDVAIDSSGNIYISSHGNHAIRKVDGATGLITTVAGTLGSPGSTGDGGLATSAELNNLYSVAVDSSGNIYIADTGNLAIRKVDAATGVIDTIAGILGSHGTTGDGGLATGALLGAPIGVALDSSGNIYIAELDNHVIREDDAATGIISTVVGTLGTSGATGDGGPATSANLNNPYDVAVDSLGNIYIADAYNHAIRKVEAPLGVSVNVPSTSAWGLAALAATLLVMMTVLLRRPSGHRPAARP